MDKINSKIYSILRSDEYHEKNKEMKKTRLSRESILMGRRKGTWEEMRRRNEVKAGAGPVQPGTVRRARVAGLARARGTEKQGLWPRVVQG